MVIKKHKKSLYNLLWFSLLFGIYFIIFGKLSKENETFITGDAIKFYVSRYYIAQQVKSGIFPLWSQYIMNGMPYAASLQGVFYLPTYIALFLSFKNFILVYYSFHIALGSFFCGKYVYKLSNNRLVGCIWSVVLFFSIMYGGYRRLHPNIQCSIVYLPVILYFFECYFGLRKTCRKWFYIFLISLIMSMQFFQGETGLQISLYTDFALFIYFLLKIYYSSDSGLSKIKVFLIDGVFCIGTYIVIILIQLAPAIKMISFYNSIGATDSSFEFFTSYSIHPQKIIMMLFPYFWGRDNIYEPLGSFYSSGFDIEIYLGAAVFSLFIYSIVYLRKNQFIRMAWIMMVISFIFASFAHYDLISKTLFKIPFVNSLRVSSRILFVFVFFAYCCSAISLSSIIEERSYKKYLKVNIGLICFILAVGIMNMLISIFVFRESEFGSQANIVSVFNHIREVFFSSIQYYFLLVVILVSILVINIGNSRWKAVLLSGTILILSVIELYPMWSVVNPSKMDEMENNNEISKLVKANIGYNDYWCAYPGPNGSMSYLYTGNKGSLSEVSNITAYESFNNPAIYKILTEGGTAPYNFSELLTGSVRARDNLYLDNASISMLGIKYIEDPMGFIGDNGEIPVFEGGHIIFSEDEIKVTSASSSNVFVWQKEIELKDNTDYRIEFVANTKKATNIYVDFYADCYDFDEQNVFFDIIPTCDKRYMNYVNSKKVPEKVKTYLRVVSISEEPCEINNLEVYENGNNAVTCDWYKPFYIDASTRIFENVNVQNILFSPRGIKHVNNVNEIFRNASDLDFINYVYAEEDEANYSGEVEIQNINYKNSNVIKADIKSNGTNIIEFSQNYNPNWHAYIDDIETEVYCANGVQMYIIIPNGEHIIKLEYKDYSIIVFSIWEVFVILTALFMFILTNNFQKRK